MPPPSAPLDCKTRVFIAVVVIMGVLIFTGAADRLSDMVFHPWARADPSLLRPWVGQLTTGNGVRLAVAINLRRARSRRGTPCARCSQIEGSAATCDPRGTLLRYRVSGSPDGRQAERLHLGASPEREPPPDGLELSVLSGTWDGGSQLDLEADFIWRRDGAAVSSTADPANQPVTLQMEPTDQTAIDTLCSMVTPRAGAAPQSIWRPFLTRPFQPVEIQRPWTS